MGWIYAVNPFVGVFVYEVVEPAGKPPKGKSSMVATCVDRCSSTGNVVGYRVDEVFATKAEAEMALAAARAEWDKQEEEKAARAAAWKAAGYPRRVHLHTRRDYWLEKKHFVEARKKRLALCETSKKRSVALTTDMSKVTCQRCLSLYEGIRSAEQPRE